MGLSALSVRPPAELRLEKHIIVARLVALGWNAHPRSWVHRVPFGWLWCSFLLVAWAGCRVAVVGCRDKRPEAGACACLTRNRWAVGKGGDGFLPFCYINGLL